MPFATGIKHINSITSRLTGKNSIEERLNNRVLEALAEWQHEFNRQHFKKDQE